MEYLPLIIGLCPLRINFSNHGALEMLLTRFFTLPLLLLILDFGR